MKEMSDEEVFGGQEMSDEEVFGKKRRTPKEMATDPVQFAKDWATAAPQAAASALSGMVAKPVSGYVGAIASAFPGEAGQGARAAADTEQSLTYQPENPVAQKLLSLASIPGELMEKGTDWAGGKVTDISKSPEAGTATKMALQAIPMLLGMRGIRGAGKPAAPAPTPSQQTMMAARKAGYVTQPDSKLGATLTAVGGKEVLNQEATWHNQTVSNELARKAAGLKPDEPITNATLEAARQSMEGPYRELASLSKNAAGALQEMKSARAEKKKWYEHYNRTAHPDSLDKARAFEAEEKFWDHMMDVEAKAAGRPDLVKDLKAARVKLAKNYDVDRFHNEATGDIDARAVGRYYAKKKGKGISDELSTIGSFASGPGFKFTRDVSRIGAPGGQHGSAIETGMGAYAGYHAGGFGGAMLGGGIPLLRGPARSMALSDFVQGTGAPSAPGLSLGQFSKRLGRGSIGLVPEGLRREESD